MSSAHQPTQPIDPETEEAQRHRRILNDLIDMGAELARHIHHQVTTQAESGEPARPPLPDLVAAFDRATRAVRRTIMLARHVAQPPPQPRAVPGPNRAAARKRIIREVEDAIQRECEGKVAKALDDELIERLDSPDLDDEIKHRSTKDIIADICRDLGIAHIEGTHPWKRRTPLDIAALCARAFQPPATRSARHFIDEPTADRPPKIGL